MKSLNDNIRIIALFWFLMQGIILELNRVRVYFEYGSKIIDNIFIIGVFLIVISLLLAIKHRKSLILLGIALFLYSVFTVFFMGLLFFMEANTRYIWGAIFLCFVIPIINVFLSVLLLLAAVKRRFFKNE